MAKAARGPSPKVIALANKAKAILKKRGHSTALSDVEMAAVAKSLEAEHDAERTAQEIIWARNDADAPQATPEAPAEEETSSNAENATEEGDASEPKAEQEIGGLKGPPDTRPSDYAETVGVCTIKLPLPVRMKEARAWAAYHARALRIVVQLCEVTTGKVLETFDASTPAPEVPAESAPALNDGAPIKRRTLTARSGDGAAPSNGGQRAPKGKYDPVTNAGAELAKTKGGASREALNALSKKMGFPDPLNWKGMLESFAKKNKLVLTSDKSTGKTIYRLTSK